MINRVLIFFVNWDLLLFNLSDRTFYWSLQNICVFEKFGLKIFD